MLTFMVGFVTYRKNNRIFSNHTLFFGRCKFHVLVKSCFILWKLLYFWEISLKKLFFSNYALFFGRCKFYGLFKSCLIFRYLRFFIYLLIFLGNILKKLVFSQIVPYFLVVVNFMFCSNHALFFDIYWFFGKNHKKNAMYLRQSAPDLYKGFHGSLNLILV